MSKAITNNYEAVISELSRTRLHALGARFRVEESCEETFVYSFLRWTLRITAARFGEDAVLLIASIQPSRGLSLTGLFRVGWDHVLGPATVGPDRMYGSARQFLVALYESLRSRGGVQHDLARSKRWPSAA